MLINLLVKELVMLALLTAVGTGFARALHSRLDAGSQLALAPVFGFAASISLLTTLNFFAPLRNAFWFALLPMALVSVGISIRCWGIPRDWGSHRRTIAQLATVLIGVLAILNAPLVKRDSPGPIAWGIFDAPGYTDCIAGFAEHTNREPLLGTPEDWSNPRYDSEAWKPSWNLSARYCWAYKFQHQGGETLPATLTMPTGWLAWEMLSPYMAVCLLLAALGTFALFRLLTQSRSWFAIAPGLATSGAALFQIYMDGSAGLLAGIALMPALLVLGLLALRRTSWTATISGAVLLAGLLTGYPEMGAIVVASLAIALLIRLIARVRRGARLGDTVRHGLPPLLAAAALTVLFAPRSALWAFANLKMSGSFTKSVIRYNMQFLHLPGWLLQTREFYTFALSAPHGLTYVVVGLLLPLALIATAAYGCGRYRASWPLVVFIAVAAAQSLYSANRLDCPYCVGRTMLTTVPAIVVLVAIGIYALTRSAPSWRLILGLAVGAMAVVAMSSSLLSIERRAYRGAYMPPATLTAMAEAAARDVHGALQLEGFGQTPLWAWGEGRTTYQAMQEATKQRISLDSAYNEYGGLSYQKTRPVGDPSFTPNYDYVLTRLTSLNTGRTTLYRSGTMALQRRTKPFDATVARGVGVETFLRDPLGRAWVQRPGEELGLQQGPLTFWVSALSPAPAYLRATLRGPAGLRPNHVAGSTTTKLADGLTQICMPVPGRGKLRIAALPLLPLPEGLTYPAAPPGSTTLADENAPYVAREIELTKVRVGTHKC